jgi:hypothetical protein
MAATSGDDDESIEEHKQAPIHRTLLESNNCKT